jgi:CheY-like chemotaxis protein
MLEKGLASIQRNAAAQAKLVDDILDVSRIITGKLKLDPRLVDLVAIASEALDVIRPSADAKRIVLGFSCDVSSCRVFADPDRLRQVVWNLLSNAVKFSDPGASVALRISMDSDSACLTVTDSGRGIEADFLPFVFERFVQADASTTRRYGGLGLGLAIVRHIVELHGGSVRAASEGPGRGAEFRIHLPLRASALAAAAPAPRSDGAPQAAAPPASTLAGLCVLIVDDEPDARELLRVVLETHGAQVVAAQNVAEALAALKTQPVDAVVSDIAMPDRDGYAFVQELGLLRSRGSNAVPAIALTAYARAEDRRRALAAGFSAHVSKPIDAAELVTVLAELVSASKRAPVLT